MSNIKSQFALSRFDQYISSLENVRMYSDDGCKAFINEDIVYSYISEIGEKNIDMESELLKLRDELKSHKEIAVIYDNALEEILRCSVVAGKTSECMEEMREIAIKALKP